MIGIIPAAGKGKRLKMGCKALVKYKGKYLIEYPLQNMKQINIKKVIIIQHGNDILMTLGNYYEDIEIFYLQQKDRKGIAHAISLAEPYVNDDMLIILGDIVYSGENLIEMKKAFDEKKSLVSYVGVQPVKNKLQIRKSYGITENGVFVEKPIDVTNLKPLLGLGIYMVSNKFFDAIKKTKPHPISGEIEITETLNKLDMVMPFLLSGKYKNINSKEDLE